MQLVYRGSPCFFCEARGSCRHRQVEDEPVLVELAEKRDQHDRGQGKNLHRGNLHSRWGKAGNPTAKELQAMLPESWRK